MVIVEVPPPVTIPVFTSIPSNSALSEVLLIKILSLLVPTLTASLKVMTRLLPTATAVALSVGEKVFTVGLVLPAVVKFHVIPLLIPA